MRRTRGFTLVEILIGIVIIGILASIAIPQYQDYIIRGKITEATSALSNGRVQIEQFFQDNRTYVGGPTPAATQNFTYSFTGAPTATTYTLQAVGTGSMTGFTYTIDQTNTKSTTAAPSGWAAASMPTTCWIVRKGGIC